MTDATLFVVLPAHRREKTLTPYLLTPRDVTLYADQATALFHGCKALRDDQRAGIKTGFDEDLESYTFSKKTLEDIGYDLRPGPSRMRGNDNPAISYRIKAAIDLVKTLHVKNMLSSRYDSNVIQMFNFVHTPGAGVDDCDFVGIWTPSREMTHDSHSV